MKNSKSKTTTKASAAKYGAAKAASPATKQDDVITALSHATIEPPPVPAGFERIDVHPLFWNEQGSCNGALVAYEKTARPAGSAANNDVRFSRGCDAVVIIVSEPTRVVHAYDGEKEVGAGTAIRCTRPELQALRAFTVDPEHVMPIRLTMLPNGRLVVDMGTTPIPRSSFVPKVSMQAAAPAS